MTAGTWTLGVVAGMVVITGCSGGSSSSAGTGMDTGSGPDGGATGVVSCAESVDAGSFVCRLSMPVQGGLSGTLNSAVGCGSGTAGTDSMLRWRSSLDGGAALVIAHLGARLPVDQLGTFPLDALEINETLAADAGTSAWKTPSGACSITITGSVCSPTSVFKQRRVLYGSGACSAAAAPEPGTSAGAVTVGAFDFVGYIDP